MNTDLALLLGTQETATLEFKREVTDRNAIRKAICALANDLPNAGGGDLLIGVDDKGQAVGGVDVSDPALLKITEYRDQGLILDRPSMVVTAATFQGLDVIRVRVNASHTPPVRFENVVWVRPGPTTRRATRDDERVLSERRRFFDTPFDVRPSPSGSLRDLDLDPLSIGVPAPDGRPVGAGREPPADRAATGFTQTDGLGRHPDRPRNAPGGVWTRPWCCLERMSSSFAMKATTWAEPFWTSRTSGRMSSPRLNAWRRS